MKKLILFALLAGVFNIACATEEMPGPLATGKCPTFLRCQIYGPGNVGCEDLKNFHLTRLGDFAGAPNYRTLDLVYELWTSGGKPNNGSVVCIYKQSFNNKGMTGSAEYADSFNGNAYPVITAGSKWNMGPRSAGCTGGTPMPGDNCITGASNNP